MQNAIDAASGRDRLEFRGVCVGHYLMDKNLTVIGRPTAAFPVPALHGTNTGAVLSVSRASVRLSHVTVTHGGTGTDFARGILNAGTLNLANASSVTGNSARFGAGILNSGTLTLRDTSTVTDNTASQSGGGIYNYRGGNTILDRSATVSGNTAGGGGGGIYNDDQPGNIVTMNGSSSVSGNSGSFGGGIYTFRTFVMNGSASVNGNDAKFSGGGIGVDGGRATLNKASSISGNTGSESGGGVYLVDSGTATLNDTSSVSTNTGITGGGVLIHDGVLSMNDLSTITGNIAKGSLGSGGGIYFFAGAVNGAVDGGNVSGNSPDNIVP
jgi:hypothetical protein